MLGELSLLILSVAVLAAVVELYRLVKKGWRKEAAVYVLLLLAGGTLTVVIAIYNNFTSPLELLIMVYKPSLDWLSSIFPAKG
ncbi:hypothetical protein WMW72_32745 [Paenibacillus filicis]|uniref:Uncharacterized protein n=1 Tax=Paenibacillus filicis TaxID=669464 RepID=A0ABU9DX28_9BACL